MLSGMPYTNDKKIKRQKIKVVLKVKKSDRK